MSHVDPFNALGGFSVGIPPELVIDENGNVVNNVNAPAANVTANRVYANYYYWANGVPFTPNASASGSNTQVQFNNNGNFGASSNFTFNSSINLLTVSKISTASANLGNIANLTITGGLNGYFLQTDGSGNLTWAPAGNGSGGNGSPAGANTQVQFNNQGNFGGDAGFTYNSTTNLLTVDNISVGNITANYIVSNWDVNANVVVANYLYGDGSNISNVVAISAAVANSVAGANVTGQVNFAAVANSVAGANVSGQVGFANVANNVAGTNVSGQVANALVAGTVYTSAQPNITSVGNLTSLTVIGNTTLGNQVVANYFIGNLFGTANLARNVTLGSQPNITSVGTLTSLTVSGTTTLGNTITGNYFVGNLYGTANNATNANSALQSNTSNFANQANYATYANFANVTDFCNVSNFANVAFSVNGSNVVGQVANALVAGTVYNAAQPNITSVGTLSNVTVSGNISSGNVFANTGTVQGSLLIGTLATPLQPNIAQVGTLSNLNVTGNISAGNISGGNRVSANFLSGTLTTNSQSNINYLGNVAWLNVDTTIANGNGNITFNGSMSGIGAASNINITGNLQAGNYVLANMFIGSIATANQPNINQVGNLVSLTVVGTSNLGNVGNVKILGGSNGYVLSTDGIGNLNWVPQSGGNGNATSPGGLNTYIQFNDNGVFGGDNTFTWNKDTNNLFIGGNANASGVITASILKSNVATGTAPLEVNSTTPVANLGVETSATVRNASQPNITSLGTLTSLAVSGNIIAGNISANSTFSAPNITVSGTIGTTNLNVSGNANLTGNLTVSGTGTLTVNSQFNSAGSSNVNLGNVSNLHISGGINGYVLATDGAGNLYWSAGGGGGNGSPGGSNTQVQYNDNGAFNGSSFFTFNENTNNVQIAGNLISNSVTLGSGIYQFSHSNVYFATTNSVSPNQVLLAIEADNGVGGGNIAAVDYTIISTDDIIRNFIKISCVRMNSTINYVEYSTLPINGYTGDFQVQYNAGNVITPATIQLVLTPQSGNLMTHKMMITAYYD